jgi:hypothetical protein
MFVVSALTLAATGVVLGFGRRYINRAAVRRWPSAKPGFQSYNARLVSLTSATAATFCGLIVVALFRGSGWALFIAAVPFILIGETRNFP